MSCYVDALLSYGWKLRGRDVPSCHLVADTLEELHAMAEAIGMKRSWFQPKSAPHYDLTAGRRELAVALGAVEMERAPFIAKVREIRQRSQSGIAVSSGG